MGDCDGAGRYNVEEHGDFAKPTEHLAAMGMIDKARQSRVARRH